MLFLIGFFAQTLMFHHHPPFGTTRSRAQFLCRLLHASPQQTIQETALSRVHLTWCDPDRLVSCVPHSTKYRGCELGGNGKSSGVPVCVGMSINANIIQCLESSPPLVLQDRPIGASHTSNYVLPHSSSWVQSKHACALIQVWQMSAHSTS